LKRLERPPRVLGVQAGKQRLDRGTLSGSPY
jgi:hypothetical protein